MGPISATPSEILPIYQEDQDPILPLDSRHWLSAHPYYLQCAHFHLSGPGLNWATRLHGHITRSGQLSARHAFNMTWGRTTNRSLTNIDGINRHQDLHALLLLYHNPARSPFIYQHMVISMIVNIASRALVSTYILQVTGNHPTSTGLSIAKHTFDPGPT